MWKGLTQNHPSGIQNGGARSHNNCQSSGILLGFLNRCLRNFTTCLSSSSSSPRAMSSLSGNGWNVGSDLSEPLISLFKPEVIEAVHKLPKIIDCGLEGRWPYDRLGLLLVVGW
jgi:hypothetical protein